MSASLVSLPVVKMLYHHHRLIIGIHKLYSPCNANISLTWSFRIAKCSFYPYPSSCYPFFFVYNTASLPCGANHTWHLTISLILQTFHHMGCRLFCVRKIASKMSTLRKMKSFSQFGLKSPCLTASAVFWHNAVCYHVHRQSSTLFILSCPIWVSALLLYSCLLHETSEQ